MECLICSKSIGREKPSLQAPTSWRSLLFFLGRISAPAGAKSYGINAFKVREVMRTPSITAAPGYASLSVEGMVKHAWRPSFRDHRSGQVMT